MAVPRDHLALWLDAADPRSVERAADGGVATWRDKSGRARDAAQPEAARRPQYAADALLGRPALKFSETTKTWLAVPDLAAQKITATIFAVVSNPEPGSEVNHDPRVLTASDGQGYDYVVGLALSVPGLETGGPRVLSGVYRDKWAKVVHVGCFSPGLQTYLTGLVSEILVYDRALTPDETAQVRAYLACKWRLP